MGIVRMGIPEDISIFIKELYKINRFVETGTFHGGTAVWASQNFRQVDTIEFSEDIYFLTKKKYENIKNINFIFGDSRSVLKEISLNEAESVLFWLDAHWCTMGSYGEKDQCPLIEELKIINATPNEHFILIDDARLFMAPPPLPNLIKFYPTINEIISVLKNQFLTIYQDVIFISPLKSKEAFCHFLQEKTTKDWNELGENNKKQKMLNDRSRYEKTKSLMKDILNVWTSK